MLVTERYLNFIERATSRWKGHRTLEVTFRTKKLQKSYESYREAQKNFGDQVARKFILRVNTFHKARNFDEIRRLPALDCHELKGKYKGQWAVKLTGRYRLIFEIAGELNDELRVLEVSNHYGD